MGSVAGVVGCLDVSRVGLFASPKIAVPRARECRLQTVCQGRPGSLPRANRRIDTPGLTVAHRLGQGAPRLYTEIGTHGAGPPNFPRHKLAGALAASAAKALGLRHTGDRRVERVCLQPALPRASATYCRLSSRPRALPHCLLYYIQTAAVPPSRLVHTPPPSPSPLSGNCQPSRLHPHHLLRQPQQPHLPNPTPRLHTQW